MVPTDAPLPDNISAAGARRHAAAAAAAAEGLGHGVPASGHAKVATQAEPDDPVDGVVEAALRRATGESKVYHERMDHAKAREAKEIDAGAKPRVQPRRRPGFGSTGACAMRDASVMRDA